MGNFDSAAVDAVLAAVTSFAEDLGRFEIVSVHEPKNVSQNGIFCAIWVQSIRPARSSGLAATTGVLTLTARIYTNFVQQPFDAIDPDVLKSVCDLMGAMTGDFDFGQIANVRNVDVLGMTGSGLNAEAGYVEIDRHVFRVMTVTIPIIINDMFSQAG